MKLKFLVISAALAMNLAYANQPEVELEGPEVAHEQEHSGRSIAKSDPAQGNGIVEDKAGEEGDIDEEKMKDAVNADIAKQEPKKEEKKEEASKDLDAIESEKHKLKRLAEKQEQDAKKVKEKSDKLAKKSDKYEDKSDELEDDSKELSDESKKNKEKSDLLAKEIESSPENEKRENVIKQICLKKLANSKLKFMQKGSKEERLEKCVIAYKESDLKQKIKIKKAYIGGQCTFNPGVSIECPEGTYKFIGSSGLSNVNGGERGEKKEGEKVEKTDKPESAKVSQK